MANEPRDRTVFPTDTTPHATEVWDAQLAVDDAGARRRTTPLPGRVAADLARLRELVGAYGADRLHRMIDSLE
jgi:hypothetical protein